MLKKENIETPELEPVKDDELEKVTGGKGFVVVDETVIGGDNKITSK